MEEPNNFQVNECSIMFPNCDFWRFQLSTVISCEKDLLTMPPGYLFVPSDVELIKFYLRKKIMNEELPINQIYEVPVYDYHPEQLTAKYKLARGREWYFFTNMKKKYPKGSRPSRSAGEGYWKPTGIDKAIRDVNGQIIGYRKSLDYYTGKNRQGKRSEWKMHEYKLEKTNFSKSAAQVDGCVLCKIYKKQNGDLENKKDESTDVVSDDISVVPKIEELVCHGPLIKETVDAKLDKEKFDIDMDYEFLQLQEHNSSFRSDDGIFDFDDDFPTL